MSFEQAEKEAREAWEALTRHYGSGVGLAKAFDDLHPAQRHWLVTVRWHLRSAMRR